MKRLIWVLSAGLMGCSGEVDLGEADPPNPSEALGSELKSFAPMPWGMCGLLQDERAYCWGWEGSTAAKRVPNLDGIALSANTGGEQICAVHGDGTVACSRRWDEALVPRLGIMDATDVSVGGDRACSLGKDGTIRQWFPEACPNDGDPRPIRLPSPAVQVHCGFPNSCAVTEDGHLYCAPGGSLEDCHSAFQEVPGVVDAVSVGVTMSETCVLHQDGTVSCAPIPERGLFPDFTKLTPMANLSGVVQLRSSRIGTCSLGAGGTLKCWGTSQCGAFGLAEGCGSTEVPAPIAVQQELQNRVFGLMDGLTCSLDARGDVWCWGLLGWNGSAKGSPLARRIQF